MLETKITYIASDGTEFPEDRKTEAVEYENNLEKFKTDLSTEVLCFNKFWEKTDYESASYIWIKSLEGARALNHFCEKHGFYRIWERNSGPDLEEKAGFYVWDNENSEWFNVENTITNLKEILENFSKNS